MMSKGLMTLSGLAICLGTTIISVMTLPGTSIRAEASTDADKSDSASNWNVEITYPGQAKQKAYIRVRNGVIYPHAKVNNNPSGKAYIDDYGYMHIVFDGHPKVAVGEAVLEKVANGKWAGVLTQAGGESRIELKRD